MDAFEKAIKDQAEQDNLEYAVKEKAKELFEKFRTASRHKYIERTGQDADEAGKQLSLLAVDEIINTLDKHVPGVGFGSALFDNPKIKFWEDVRNEIQNI